jgi:hypothetical protein
MPGLNTQGEPAMWAQQKEEVNTMTRELDIDDLILNYNPEVPPPDSGGSVWTP